MREYPNDKAISSALEKLVTRFGPKDVIHAVNKWSNRRAVTAKLRREKKEIEARLLEIEEQGI